MVWVAHKPIPSSASDPGENRPQLTLTQDGTEIVDHLFQAFAIIEGEAQWLALLMASDIHEIFHD